MVKIVYIALGSSLGDRDANLRTAREKIQASELRIMRASHVYETEPRDADNRPRPGEPWFLNQVVEAETLLMPRQVLDRLLRIEREMGRRRTGGAAAMREPRLIDLDLLLYGGAAMRSRELEIPHPRMTERRFVLEPLAELAPDLRIPAPRHPQTLRTVRDWLTQVMDQTVRRL